MSIFFYLNFFKPSLKIIEKQFFTRLAPEKFSCPLEGMFLLQMGGFGDRSKFGRELDLHVEISKIKNL